jgi:hypothetical protein
VGLWAVGFLRSSPRGFLHRDVHSGRGPAWRKPRSAETVSFSLHLR